MTWPISLAQTYYRWQTKEKHIIQVTTVASMRNDLVNCGKVELAKYLLNPLVTNTESLFTKLDLSEKFLNRQPFSINSMWALLHEDFCKN